MNIALEQTRELVDGKLRRNYGDAFVRGNNGESGLRKCSHERDADSGSDVHIGRFMNASEPATTTWIGLRRS